MDLGVTVGGVVVADIRVQVQPGPLPARQLRGDEVVRLRVEHAALVEQVAAKQDLADLVLLGIRAYPLHHADAVAEPRRSPVIVPRVLGPRVHVGVAVEDQLHFLWLSFARRSDNP